MHFTTIIFRFTDIIFFGYLYSQSIDTKLADVITDENNLLEELSSMSLSVIILQIDLLMDKVRQKKLHLLYFVGTFIVEYNISPTRKPYVIPSMIFLFYR
jgi:sulfur relay (sulfurtransferase) DsrC/TusE family protein